MKENMEIPHELIGTNLQMIWRSGLNSAPPIHIWTGDRRMLDCLSIVHYREHIETGQTMPSALVLIAQGPRGEGPYLLWWIMEHKRQELETKVAELIKEFSGIMVPYEICNMSIEIGGF